MPAFVLGRPIRLTAQATTSLSGSFTAGTDTPAANAFTLTGPTSGTTGVASTFTVTPNGQMATSVVVTNAATNSGSIAPLTLTFAAGSSAAQTFTVTRAADGSSSVSITNSGGLTNAGTPIVYTSSTSATINALTITTEGTLPEQIALYLIPIRTLAASTVTVRYKPISSSTWVVGHPLLRIDPTYATSTLADAPQPVIDAFAGCIFDLTPGASYDVELTHTEAGQPVRTSTIQRTTRSLPAVAGSPNKTCTPGTIVAAIAGLVPGDVLELQAGTYTGAVTVSGKGSSGSPIYIRGANRSTVIINASGGTGLNIQGCTNIVFENLSVTGDGIDHGVNPASIFAYLSGSSSSNITLRDISASGVDLGVIIAAACPQTGMLVYRNTIYGNNAWSESLNANATWNDDGCRLTGVGNCVFENTMRGFGDCFSSAGTAGSGDHCSAGFIYRNLIQWTCDDLHEADYATRNIAFYDNHCSNSGTAWSCDPIYGGPAYYFRNVSLNTFRGPYKLNSSQAGFLIYNNTVCHTSTYPVTGSESAGWYLSGGGGGISVQQWAYRNNLLVHRNAASLYTMWLEQVDNNPIDFDHNAWFPDKRANWSDVAYSTMTLAIAGASTPATTPVFGTATKRNQSDVVTVTNPWTTTLTLGASHATQLTGATFIPTLSGSSTPKNAGVDIPGITTGFTGSSPDIGAIISGRAVPVWGSSLPSYLSSAAIFQWVQVPNGNIATAGVAPTVDPPPGRVACVINSWGGLTVRQSSGHLIAHGGGHADYGGNEIYALSLASESPAWSRVWGPTPGSLVAQIVTEYADGHESPASTHTYYMNQWDETSDRLMQIGGGSYTNPTGLNPKVYSWNWGASWWNAASTHPQIPISQFNSGAGIATHPTTGDIYVQRNRSLARWNRSLNTWTTLADNSSTIDRHNNAMTIDPMRSCAWSFGGSSGGSALASGRVEKWDLNTTLTQLTVTGASASITTGEAFACARDSVSDLIYLYRGDGVLHVFNPGAMTINPVTTTGTAPSANSVYNPIDDQNTWGRLHYVSNLRALVLKPAWDSPTFIMRVSA